MTETDRIRALDVPGAVEVNGEGLEMVRFWVSGNVDHSSLRVGATGDPPREIAMWGFILADLAKHAVTALRAEYPDGPAPQQVLEQMMGAFAERLKHNPELGQVFTKDDT